MRSHKLKNSLERLTRRSLRDTAQRISGDGDIIKARLRGVIKKLNDLPKDALKTWKAYVLSCHNKKLLDNLRSQKLFLALFKIPKSTLRGVCERLLGEGNLVKGAIRRIQLSIQKKPKAAFEL